MTSITDILNAWYSSSDEVVRFGRDLLHGGMFDMFDVPISSPGAREAAYRLLNYFEKPWHWDREHAWWVANDWPDDVESWERGLEAKWEITHD